MRIVLIIAGAIAGMFLVGADEVMLGLGAGAALGYLAARLLQLEARVRDLTSQLARLRAGQAPAETPGQAHAGLERSPAEPTGAEPAGRADAGPGQAPAETGGQARAESATASWTSPISSPTSSAESVTSHESPDGPLQRLAGRGKDWLTTGNVPVKVGVIISFLGVAFLLRYAVDQGFIVISIEARYLAVSVIAAALLAVGWRLREKLPVYALSLQGGGIGVLYLTIFAAFRLHEIVPAWFAFALLVALTAFAGLLSVLQNSMALATLGAVGGFLAPVLVSTGSGNHVALFSYYLLLNGAILGIAWYRPWRFLNVLGFVFTFGVGTMWGYEYYRPELFASTEPFLVAFFLLYQGIAILFATRQEPRLRGFVDGTLVFGTPVIAFALQARLVVDMEYGLAISAIALAIFYTLVATGLHRARLERMRLMIESFIALSVAFATVAIPLALDDRWTAAAWSLEGAALVWIGVRQHRVLARLAGVALLGAAGVAFIDYGWTNDLGIPFFNGNLLGGMLIGVAALFSARQLATDDKPIPGQSIVSGLVFAWGLLWWIGTGGVEIEDRLSGDAVLHVITTFIASSIAALAWLGRRYDWTAARRATLAYLPVLPLIAILYLVQHQHLFAGAGTLVWLLATAVHFGLLRAYDNGRGRIESLWHIAGAFFVAAMLAAEVYWRLNRTGLADAWPASGMALVPALIAFAIVFMRRSLPWPLERYAHSYVIAAATLVVAQLGLVAIIGIDDPGDPLPLPYVPVLNPYDLLTFVGLGVALYVLVAARETLARLGQGGFRALTVAWAAAAFALSTIAVVRGVHHFGGVPWREQALASSNSVQSALSIYWAILGFSGMIYGARQRQRTIWIIGTSLMALVVVKLFLVDLGNTGTVARIVSFLGVGALLLVVGYYAPAPPRAATGPEE